MRGKAVKSLNEVEGILDLFEIFERLQVIIDRNYLYIDIMGSNEAQQWVLSSTLLFIYKYMLLVPNKRCA